MVSPVASIREMDRNVIQATLPGDACAIPDRVATDGARPAGSPPDPAAERLANGWLLLRSSRLAAERCMILIQPGIGVGLLELEPAWTADLVGQFRALLDSSDFGAMHPGHLPVIHRRLRPADIAFLPIIMEEAFVWQDPISVEAAPGSWESTLSRLLLAPASPRTAPAPDVLRRAVPAADAVPKDAAPGPPVMDASPGRGPGDHQTASVEAESGRMSGRPGRGRPLVPLALLGLVAGAAVMVFLDQEHPASGPERARSIATLAPAAQALVAQGLVASPAPATQDARPSNDVSAGVADEPELVAAEVAPEPRSVPAADEAPEPPSMAVAAMAPDPSSPAAEEIASGPPPDAPIEAAQEPPPVAATEASPDAPPAAAVGAAPEPLPAAAAPAPPWSEPGPMAIPSPPPAAMAASAVPDRAVNGGPAIDPGQIAVMLRRGQALLAVGDISGARRFFERAAAGGSAAAARAIAETYDPRILAEQRALGPVPDQAAALAWYRRAAALGAAQEVAPAIVRLEAAR